MDWKEALGKLNVGDFPAPSREEDNIETEKPDVVRRETLRVVIDRKGRKGKTATIVEGFQCSDEEVKNVARELKTRIGAGGSSRGSEILIQGECVDKVAKALESMGYKVKR